MLYAHSQCKDGLDSLLDTSLISTWLTKSSYHAAMGKALTRGPSLTCAKHLRGGDHESRQNTQCGVRRLVLVDVLAELLRGQRHAICARARDMLLLWRFDPRR